MAKLQALMGGRERARAQPKGTRSPYIAFLDAQTK